MAAFPADPEHLTTDWLSAAVGGSVTGFECEQIAVGVGLMGRLCRIHLEGNGVPSSVVAKFPTLDEIARGFVAAPLRFYEKEVRFYNEMAKRTPIGTAKTYAADFDESTGDFVLLLEDLCDRRVEDQTIGCSIEDAQIAIDAMAAMHAAWWEGDFASVPWLPAYSDEPYPEVIAGMYSFAWAPAQEIFGSHLSDTYKAFGERFASLVPWFLHEGAKEPQTLVHGDFRLDNLFFGCTDAQAPVSAVDWQICLRGRAGYDVAYFISQSLTTDVRREHEQGLLDRYLEALGIDYPEFMTDYRRTVAYCFIYAVIATGMVEIANERQRELLLGNLDRAVAAIEDLDALSLLPTN